MSDAPEVTLRLDRVAAIIPALNERAGLSTLLPQLKSMNLGQIIVADNGSTDGSDLVARRQGVTLVHEPKRGYGAACFRGMTAQRDEIVTVVFLDADLSDDVLRLPDLVALIAADECDFVIGTRVPRLRERGSMTAPQIVGDTLACWAIRWGWGHRYSDLGPFRAIRRSALDAIDMQDRGFGWTLEMQVRAVELKLRIREVPVRYRRRKGRSKISGTFLGILRAGHGIITTCARLWWTRRSRLP